MISISHYAMGDVSRDYDAIVEAFSGRGVEPGVALGSNLPDPAALATRSKPRVCPARAYAHFSSSCPAWPRAVGAAQ